MIHLIELEEFSSSQFDVSRRAHTAQNKEIQDETDWFRGNWKQHTL